MNTKRRLFVGMSAIGAMSLLAIVLVNLHVLRPPQRPGELPQLVFWLSKHPADWLAATAITDQALDSELPMRLEIWRSSHRLARHLAPLRPNTSASFVRAGLFHWSELDERDRAEVIAAAAPLMRDPAVFSALYAPMFRLTHDMAWLRRVAPDDLRSASLLTTLAASEGLFGDYRELRELQRQKRFAMFASARKTSTLGELMQLLPARLEMGDAPLVRGLLEEIDRRPFDSQQLSGRTQDVVLFAMRHRLQPLEGLRPLVEAPQLRAPTRARLALALGDRNAATRIEVTSAIPGSAEWTPYYLERARFEAAHGNAAAADSYLGRAALNGISTEVLGTAWQVATALGQSADARRYAAQLDQRAGVHEWTGTCAPRELCSSASTVVFTRTKDVISISLIVVQTDESPPYVEIYVDDALAAQGAVDGHRTFAINASAGAHRVDVQLVNRYTPSGVSRRLRLS